MGKHQRKMYKFLMTNKGWHTLASDWLTQRTLQGLKERGHVATNHLGQVKAI